MPAESLLARCVIRRGEPFDEVRRAAGFEGELATRQACPRVTSPHSSSCTSSKARCSSEPAFPIGIVTAIAAPAALRVTWTEKEGTPARS